MTQAVTLAGLGSTTPTIVSPTLSSPSYTGTLTGGAGVVALGTNQLYKDAAGNVGIGTSSPSKKLEVYASANSLQIESIVRNDQPGTGVAAIGFNVSSVAASETTSTKAGIGLQRGSPFGAGALCFYNNNSGAAGDFTTADERMRIDSTGQQSSTIVGYGTYNEYKCRAWVNFNGTGTVAIRASGNVSSITDNGVGLYTVNFTTAMPDADYSAVNGSPQYNMRCPSGANKFAGSIQVNTNNSSNVGVDSDFVSVSIFR